MRLISLAALVLIAASCSVAAAKPEDHQWSTGKVLDEDRARYFAGMINNSSSQTTENGSVSGTANSTSYGDSTNTQIDGSYQGTRSTSSSGYSVPVYRVYDNLVIEGDDTIYITSEHIRWRWSKGAHVAVNGTVKYYVDGRKLHLLDDDNKEHTAEIVKEIRKTPQVTNAATPTPSNGPQVEAASAPSMPVNPASVAIDSTPEGADIEIDGAFVGNTPSTVPVAPGSHEITVKKKGFSDWARKLSVTGGSVHLSADLDPVSPPTDAPATVAAPAPAPTPAAAAAPQP
jgi:hypothetical protein